ncbi:glycoside hydrolase family 66 protein [Planctomicrobium sp. SH661]|uniref:glycoside hydrolase family 66 protein n=1 Tax=Planctomicrobium sp. SH661 TaxID=3448124 RepID=UPI003F5B6756
MIRLLLSLMTVALAIPSVGATTALGQGGGLESPTGNSEQSGNQAKSWTGPARNTVPDWAQPGKIRFSRWDGGRIETVKAILSGWTGFAPTANPDLVYPMTNWYEPETISLLKQAGINLVWVTFSVGFSNETERRHQEQVRAYIAECHRQGIHVMAYESVANMFWNDMFRVHPESREWTSLDKNGKPVLYGASPARYMANLEHPGWRAYLLGRIDLAIDAGADGIMYDNNFGSRLPELYTEIQQHATSRKPDFLIMANFHGDGYQINRMINCITTEDGREPGIYKKEGKTPEEMRDPAYIEANWVNNVGLLRIHEALSDGWKPVMVENGRRESAAGEPDSGNGRMVALPAPKRCQLSLAEPMMFGVAHELFIEGGTAFRLWTQEPEMMKSWEAIGIYNRFFAEHEDLYVGARSQADVLAVISEGDPKISLLEGLAARKLLFNVQYDTNVRPEQLSQYQTVLLLGSRVHSSLWTALSQFGMAGKSVIAIESAASQDETGKPVASPFIAKIIPYRGREDIAALTAAITAATPKPGPTLEAPPGVLFNVTTQSNPARTLVHLLNYTLEPTGPIKLTLPEAFQQVRQVSPDQEQAALRVFSSTERGTEVEIPQLHIYSVLILDQTSEEK